MQVALAGLFAANQVDEEEGIVAETPLGISRGGGGTVTVALLEEIFPVQDRIVQAVAAPDLSGVILPAGSEARTMVIQPLTVATGFVHLTDVGAVKSIRDAAVQCVIKMRPFFSFDHGRSGNAVEIIDNQNRSFAFLRPSYRQGFGGETASSGIGGLDAEGIAVTLFQGNARAP